VELTRIGRGTYVRLQHEVGYEVVGIQFLFSYAH